MKIKWYVMLVPVALVLAFLAILPGTPARAGLVSALARVATPVIEFQGNVLYQQMPYAGIGYFRFAILDSAGMQLWGNDASGASIPLLVENGKYTARLGDLSVPGMTSPLDSAVFAGGHNTLRIWFSPDNRRFTLLSPDQPIDQAADFTLRYDQAPVLPVAEPGSAPEIAAGAAAVGQYGDWQPVSTLNAPSASSTSVAVWTGSEMLVWDYWSQQGGRYDPVLDSWTPITTTNPPAANFKAMDIQAAWAADRMVIWYRYYNSNWYTVYGGRRYDPTSNTWAAVSLVNAPTSGMGKLLAAGSQVLLWNGQSGARYDPLGDLWTPITTTLAPAGGSGQPLAVWTGSQMLTWNGSSGGSYDPSLDSWTPITTTNSHPAYSGATAIWNGAEMVVWGGESASGLLNTGARYNPSSDTWSPVSTQGTMPTPRREHSAVWTGSEMVVWGGRNDSSGVQLTGGRFDPASNSWAPTPIGDAPPGRYRHTALWTGDEMLIWGGMTQGWGGYPEPMQAETRRLYLVVFMGGNTGIGGTLTAANGAPADNIAVTAYTQIGGTWTPVASIVSDAAGGYQLAPLFPGDYRLHFQDLAGVHRSEYYTGTRVIQDALDVSVLTGTLTANTNHQLSLPAPPAALVSGTTAGVTADPWTGLVAITYWGGSTGNIQITSQVTCTSGAPANVVLHMGAQSFPMSLAAGASGWYTTTIPASSLVTGTTALTITYRCGETDQVKPVGEIILRLFDPSGKVYNRYSRLPVANAVVTLFRVPGWLPDLPEQIRDCATIQTRDGDDWSAEPPALPQMGIPIDAWAEQTALNPQISPQINPQRTGSDGYYGWDVAEGCWFVSVQAAGYRSQYSPVVGVPPEVTDLDIYLEARNPVFLPIIRQKKPAAGR